MAFNFNWSPLFADTDRARDMLTTALNKSPKPPILVDDIIVTELNLGTEPPDVEILEVGDLADDRFRGIFKMTYAGDAFLTLKSRVQANPLNTYLSTKPSFASPQPLAAASGLTIPLAITLSNIRLSGFVILVFSKSKGLTIVFRNDPLESLKVSSTFDSIPFVRDYLQKVIEKQLRILFMEDLPAILHRLSLRLWSPDYCDPSDPIMPPSQDDALPVDPLASPPQDSVDWLETVFGQDAAPSVSLEARTEPTTFSSRNLHLLSALGSAHQTLDVATPTMKHVLFRAWAASSERNSGIQTPIRPSPWLAESSHDPAPSTTSSAISGSGSELSRPNLSSSSSTSSYTYSKPAGRQRKPKRRVIDLRRCKTEISLSDQNTPLAPLAPLIIPSPPPVVPSSSASSTTLASISEEPCIVQATKSAEDQSFESQPCKPTLFESQDDCHHARNDHPPAYTSPKTQICDFAVAVPATAPDGEMLGPHCEEPISQRPAPNGRMNALLRSTSVDSFSLSSDSSPTGILTQAWMRKMAHEIARRVHDDDDDQIHARLLLPPHVDKGDAAAALHIATLQESQPDSRPLLADAPPAYAS